MSFPVRQPPRLVGRSAAVSRTNHRGRDVSCLPPIQTSAGAGIGRGLDESLAHAPLVLAKQDAAELFEASWRVVEGAKNALPVLDRERNDRNLPVQRVLEASTSPHVHGIQRAVRWRAVDTGLALGSARVGCLASSRVNAKTATATAAPKTHTQATSTAVPSLTRDRELLRGGGSPFGP
jgi:hypothetical protein